MFLIMPTSHPPPVEPSAATNGSLAVTQQHHQRGSRVKQACDRCRMKKCDCDVPCLRCMQDHVVCVVSKRDGPSDPKAAAREYIQSMEANQRRLVEALKQMRKLACGFDFEGVPEVVDEVDTTENNDPAPIPTTSIQWPSKAADWLVDSFTIPETEPVLLALDSSGTMENANALNGPDSMMWWDPSMLLNMDPFRPLSHGS
ncbi:hypothetical protein K490DRAFT_60412 [Saccharata proteae CBS 121410]|uniref:Zn(2)-C6 fungal-type domain-containing protein n=1 Tax=Saccharata proteae CBS 121410 TaxID=1314787 RepID=A0A9P4HQ05_9PEZI|nr:hypothetical protein K490DRAFT_60412 [Saccharata proteae CBS 121410]